MGIDNRNIEVLDEQTIEILKKKSPQQRLIIAFNMWTFAKKHLTNYLRGLYPHRDEKEIQKEVVRRLSHGAI
ncbi:MAG: hypothetical protein AB1567_13650 [bacterium]